MTQHSTMLLIGNSELSSPLALRATSFCGLLVMIGFAWLLSSHKRRVPFRVVWGGLLLQFLAAFVILWTPPGQWLFAGISFFFAHLEGFVAAGTEFMFGMSGEQGASRTTQLTTSFAFGVLPTIIFFSSLMMALPATQTACGIFFDKFARSVCAEGICT